MTEIVFSFPNPYTQQLPGELIHDSFLNIGIIQYVSQ